LIAEEYLRLVNGSWSAWMPVTHTCI